QQHEGNHADQEGDMVGRALCAFRTSQRDVPTWSVLPSKPEEVEREKWNEPTKAVLLVDSPFATKLYAKSKPHGADKQNAQGYPEWKCRVSRRRWLEQFVWSCYVLHRRTAYQIWLQSEPGMFSDG